MLDEDVEYIINEVKEHLANIKKGTIEKLVSKIIGANINHWGEVSEVNDDLLGKVLQKEGIQEAIEDFADAVAEALKEKVKDSKYIEETADHMLSTVAEKAYDKVAEKVYDTVLRAYETTADRKLREDKAIAPYLVAGVLMEANRKDK